MTARHLSGVLAALMATACTVQPGPGNATTVPSPAASTSPVSQAPPASSSPLPSPSASPASPQASVGPAANPSPSVSALAFDTVRLLGGNGQQGDFDRTSDSGLPEKRFFDIATAIAFRPDGTIAFLEGSRNRIGLWSTPFYRPNDPPYRIPQILLSNLQQPADMITVGNDLVVSERFGHRVLRVAGDGKTSAVAGTGVAGMTGDGGLATAAALDTPMGLASDTKGNLYVADSNNQVIRRIDAKGTISTVGGMLGQAAEQSVFTSGGKRLLFPRLVAVDAQDRLYVMDDRHQIRRLEPDGQFVLVAGSGAYEDDIASSGRPGVGLGDVTDMAFGPDGWLYYADKTNHVIRRINPSLPFEQIRSETVIGSHKSDGFPYFDALPLDVTASYVPALGFAPNGDMYYFEGQTFRWLYAPLKK